MKNIRPIFSFAFLLLVVSSFNEFFTYLVPTHPSTRKREASLIVVDAIAVSIKFNEREKTSLDQLWGNVQQTYRNLPPQGKFVTGTILGYSGAQLVVGSATTALKVAGTIFVVSEVIHLSGVLEDSTKQNFFGEDQTKLQQLKASCQQVARGCRRQINQTFNPRKCRRRLQKYIEQDKYGPAGLATGILLGLA